MKNLKEHYKEKIIAHLNEYHEERWQGTDPYAAANRQKKEKVQRLKQAGQRVGSYLDRLAQKNTTKINIVP